MNYPAGAKRRQALINSQPHALKDVIISAWGLSSVLCKLNQNQQKYKYTSRRRTKLSIKGIIALVLASLMCALTSSMWVMLPRICFAEAAPVPIQMAVTINGLAPGETVTLVIGPESRLEIEYPVFTRQVLGTGASIREVIAPVLGDGHYLLLLEALGQYFREPRGFAFNVYNAMMVNPTGRTIIFNLKPQPTYLASEGVADISAPPKQLIPFTEPPLWQRLLKPAAIALVVIAAVLTALFIWRRLKIRG
jgi:hypothetical protein